MPIPWHDSTLPDGPATAQDAPVRVLLVCLDRFRASRMPAGLIMYGITLESRWVTHATTRQRAPHDMPAESRQGVRG